MLEKGYRDCNIIFMTVLTVPLEITPGTKNLKSCRKSRSRTVIDIVFIKYFSKENVGDNEITDFMLDLKFTVNKGAISP